MSAPGFTLAQQQRQIQTIAPQLRQSLEMLQKPILELRQSVYHEMARNPLLEEMVDPAETRESDGQHQEDEQSISDYGQDYDREIDGREDPYELQHGMSLEENESRDQEQELNFDPDDATMLNQDDEFRDYSLQGMENGVDLEDQSEKRQYLFDSLRQPVSLQEHLLTQLSYLSLPEEDFLLARMLVENIGNDGYFSGSLPDIEMVTSRSEKEVLRVLSIIQQFDPPGVGARTVRECLLLQLHARDPSPLRDSAIRLVDQHLELLARHDTSALCAELKVSREELARIQEMIRSLDPRPGLQFSATNTVYVEPEVTVVRERDGRYVAHVENDRIPQIHISEKYRQLLDDPGTSAETKKYVRDRLHAALFLIQSIEQRQETIRKIAQTIVDTQKDFWTKGIRELRPMTMVDVAKQVGVHETTVSRTVANKYMRTPVGVFLMKFFFSTGLKASTGGTVSNKSVQDMVAALVRAEDRDKPLSDQDIAEKLKEKGIECARRTVAKYRDILKIPSSSKRRGTGWN
ncbi:MAG: RNA polymerase factor sigma-54 [Kiritimatiellae bacterium]|nr:RNA polymerase factor sigma-54 [Kiritimatiellia bacterium]